MILKVGGNRLTDFNNVTVELKYDSVGSTFTFDYRFEPDADAENSALKALAAIGKYANCVVEFENPVDGSIEKLITGVALSSGFKDQETKALTAISGYSKTGVLDDCEIPVSLYPLQSDGKSLRQIVQKLIKPFNLNLVVDADVSARADSVLTVSTAEPSQTIKAYLATLANQKNILLSHNSNGDLLLTKARPNAAPKYNFVRGLPAKDYTLTFSGQGMHSEITVMKQADSDGGNAGQDTVKNVYVEVYRPHVVIQTSGNDNDTATSAKSVLANELRSISLDIELDTWTDEFGYIWRPNTIITVENDELNLKGKTLWFVESVTLTGNESMQTAMMKCVLPEVHNGKVPTKNIFR